MPPTIVWSKERVWSDWSGLSRSKTCPTKWPDPLGVLREKDLGTPSTPRDHPCRPSGGLSEMGASQMWELPGGRQRWWGVWEVWRLEGRVGGSGGWVGGASEQEVVLQGLEKRVRSDKEICRITD